MAYSHSNGCLNQGTRETQQLLFSKCVADETVISLWRGAWFQEIRPPIIYHKLIRVCLDKGITRLEYGSDPVKCIYLVDITHVRYGWNTDAFNQISRSKELSAQSSSQVKEDRCFSILYGPHRQTLDLQAKDCHVAKNWVSNVNSLIDAIRKRATRSDKSEWLIRHFKEADISQTGFISFDECFRLLNNLNVYLEKEQAKKLVLSGSNCLQVFKREDVLDEHEFLRLYDHVSERPELMILFQNCARGETSISAENLRKFLKEEQEMENAQVDYAQSLIDRFKSQREPSVRGKMTFSEFQAMMNSSLFDILKKEHRKINQDMRQPLSNYYISSSHNTYLVGDQLMGVSSIEGYIAALESGCRCLELDLWDGSDGQPIIYHGYTKTSKLLAKDVLIKGIKPYAFKYSPYPLILSVENHLSTSQQAVFAEDLRQVFSSSLYAPNACSSTPLPSPEQLMGKIIIKATGAKVSCPALLSLLQVCRTFTSFERLEDVTDQEKASSSYFIVSMSECEVSNSLKKLTKEPIENLQVMVRVYPTATRMGSSNFNAIPFWNFGSQMVALNFQTNDKHLEVNYGRFRRNGSCGYVLKPNYLIGKIGKFPAPTSPRQLLMLRIISSQYLPKRPGCTKKGNFYVSLKIDGHPIDSFKFKTSYLNKNGLNPCLNESIQVKIFFPQLALVCFRVKCVDTFKIKHLISSYCLPVESLASGYRHAPMSTSDIVSSILVHVKITRF